MTDIYLIRHAQSTGNIEKRLTGRVDYPLTNEGNRQVEKLTDSLKNIHFDVAYSSPLNRAVETIKPLTELNNININVEDTLSEMYFGIYDGSTWEEVNKIDWTISNTREQINEIVGIPNQETTEQVKHRMYDAVSKIVDKNKGKTILISSHGVAIEAFLREITGEPFIEKKQEYSQKNTSVNVIQYDDIKEKFKIKRLNDIKHLQ